MSVVYLIRCRTCGRHTSRVYARAERDNARIIDHGFAMLAAREAKP